MDGDDWGDDVSAEVFTTAHIVIVGVVSGVLGGLATWWLTRRPAEGAIGGLLGFAATTLWRKSANLPQLNADGLPGFSANDWLAPMLTYIVFRCYALAWPRADTPAFRQATVAATALALAVNVIGI